MEDEEMNLVETLKTTVEENQTRKILAIMAESKDLARLPIRIIISNRSMIVLI